MSSWNSRNIKQQILDRLIKTQETQIGIQAYQLANELKVSKGHVIGLVAQLRDEGHPIINEDYLSGPYLYVSPVDIRKMKKWRLLRFDLAITILNRTRKTLKRVLIDDGPYLRAFFRQLDSMIEILQHERNEIRKINVDA
jgi:hypothetical protein